MKNRKIYLVVVCLLFVALSLAFLGGQAQAQKVWKTHEGVIVKAYFQAVPTSHVGQRMKTIIVMRDKQLMFSDAYDREIPIGVKVRIQVGQNKEIIDIEEIKK